VEDESDKYRLRIAGYSGTAGDPLTLSQGPNNWNVVDGMQFSTLDIDNDLR